MLPKPERAISCTAISGFGQEFQLFLGERTDVRNQTPHLIRCERLVSRHLALAFADGVSHIRVAHFLHFVRTEVFHLHCFSASSLAFAIRSMAYGTLRLRCGIGSVIRLSGYTQQEE